MNPRRAAKNQPAACSAVGGPNQRAASATKNRREKLATVLIFEL